jgi:Tfp pilus assembly protein PilX
MMAITSSTTQRGVITIFISMVMLILITLMVVTAYSLSTTNLRAVGNVQARDEAIASANYVIEQVVESGFTAVGNDPNDAGLTDFPVHINNNDVSPEYEYLVDVAIPRCVRAYRANSVTVSSVTKPGMSASGAFNTIWELDAIATEAASGASVRVIHGIRILMDEVRKDQLCPD